MPLNIARPPSAARDDAAASNVRPFLNVPAPPDFGLSQPSQGHSVSAQAAGDSLQDNQAQIRALRQSLVDEQTTRRVLSNDYAEAQSKLRVLKSQLDEQDKEHKNALTALRTDLTAEQDKALSTQKDKLEAECSDSSNKIIGEWKDHYEGEMAKQKRLYEAQVADLRANLDIAHQSHGSAAGCTAQLEAELKSAKQHIADMHRVKAEDNTADQQAVEAQKQISSLESSLTAAQADAASYSQALLQAKKHTEIMQSQVQEAQDTFKTLQRQLEAEQLEHRMTMQEVYSKTAEHARQYASDLQDARSQNAEHRGSGARGHKRSRDSSNGRESNKRS